MTESSDPAPTFLFTDIEGSTELWERWPDDMAEAIARHDALLRAAIESRGGQVFKTVGDAVHAVFDDAASAVDAALAAQRALRDASWPVPEPPRVRIALHAGSAEPRNDDWFGPTLNRAARIRDAGHGGQTLLSRAVERRVGDRFPEGAALRDLGERRLKDLAEPERIFQLVTSDLPADFPPLDTLDARPHNLPARTTPLVGRDAEVARVRALLLSEGSRFVTLLGPGGVGKTRLAIQVAAEVVDSFRDGAWLVNLTSVTDPDLVAGEILRTWDARPEGDEPEVRALRRHLRDKELLLVLDNFEQVVAAAPLVTELLERAPGLSVLVTSQAALRVHAEREVPVSPLAPPPGDDLDLDRLRANEAVALFVQRARSALPSFDLTSDNAAAVAGIAREVDGLPLAIELAAARVKMLSPAAILERLCGNYDFLTGRGRDVPERHSALRKTIDWSHGLLSDEEKALFLRQAVFDGGYTLEAAEAICSAPDAELDVYEALASLVDKSLVRRVEVDGEPRFERLRTIRAYAVERLEASGEADRWRRRHAEWFAKQARRVDYNRASDPEAAGLLRWLERELQNVRAAFEWSIERGDADLAVRFCRTLPGLWFIKGLVEEGQRWIERALALGDALSEGQRADLNNLLGRGRQWQGDNSPEVVALFEESLALYEATGDRHGAARASMNLGNVHRRKDEFREARERFERSLAIYRDLGDTFGEASALLNLGDLANAEGDVSGARRRFEQARDVARRADNAISLAYALEYLGQVACQEGDIDAAAARFAESRAIFERLGSEPGLAWCDYYDAVVARHRGDLAAARAHLASGLERFRRLDYRPGLAACLLGFATLEALEDRCDMATRLLGAARVLHERARTSLGPIETWAIGYVAKTCRRALGDAFEETLGAGMSMPLAEALALAGAAAA